jgi:broad specificity phosphatase PhoE
MRVVLVRHGETTGQSSIRYYGATDVSLSDLGRAQMQCARVALASDRFAAVYASALSRSIESARIVTGSDAIVPLAGFNEVNFGAWEGLTADEIAARDPLLHASWRVHLARRDDFHYPGGESTMTFRARIVATLHQVLAQAPTGSLLFVVHKGVIRTMLAELLRLDDEQRPRLRVDLGSIHVVRRAGALWRAELLDEVAHLYSLDRGMCG